MKHLPKHLQPRWRYLAVELTAWPDADLDRRGFQAAVWAAGRSLLGDPGSADADLRVIRFAVEDGAGVAVVRVRRDEVAAGRAALACVDSVGGAPVGVVVVGTGGTVRACEENYLSERPQTASERTVAFDGAVRPAVARGDRLDVRVNGAWAGATDLDLEPR